MNEEEKESGRRKAFVIRYSDGSYKPSFAFGWESTRSISKAMLYQTEDVATQEAWHHNRFEELRALSKSEKQNNAHVVEVWVTVEVK